MDGTDNKSTPWGRPWHEALKRAGSFDVLRPYLHAGQIPARHGGLYTLSDGKVHSGPGILRPEKWANAYKDRAGRVILITEEVVFGRVVQEVVFAYASSIELDSVAFDTFFPVAGLPPTERELMAPMGWFRNALKDHPKEPNERASDYATKLHGLMKTAPVTKQWTQRTLYRRLYDK